MNPEDWPPLDGIDPASTLTMWTIYDHPFDYRGSWVVRRYFIVRDQHEPVLDVVPRLASSLAEARSFVPRGLYRQPRSEGDDPCIVEVWY